jgi:hypothetical protein
LAPPTVLAPGDEIMRLDDAQRGYHGNFQAGFGRSCMTAAEGGTTDQIDCGMPYRGGCKMAVVFEVAQPAALSNRAAVTAIVASTLGWSLDFFDLLILLYVAPAVGKAFFPSDSPTLSVAAIYASFAVTLFMRPVGSALFGNYADKHGRRDAMIIAVIGVGLATAAFGLLPTIAQIGVTAPILFLILKVGVLELGGKFTSASVSIGNQRCGRKATKCCGRAETLRQPRWCFDFDPPLRFPLGDEARNMITLAVGPSNSDVPSRS